MVFTLYIPAAIKASFLLLFLQKNPAQKIPVYRSVPPCHSERPEGVEESVIPLRGNGFSPEALRTLKHYVLRVLQSTRLRLGRNDTHNLKQLDKSEFIYTLQ